MKDLKTVTIELAGIFREAGDVEFAYIFGSMARGEEFPMSDLDIAVYMKKPLSLDRELALHSRICREIKSNDVDLLVLNKAKNLILIEEIIKNGIIVFDVNPPLRDSFELRILHDAIDFRCQRKVFAGR
jgi:uncharacterized protein